MSSRAFLGEITGERMPASKSQIAAAIWLPACQFQGNCDISTASGVRGAEVTAACRMGSDTACTVEGPSSYLDEALVATSSIAKRVQCKVSIGQLAVPLF
jgi:hypothetical protein